MKLESLPGVGPGLAAAIRRRFRDDGAFFAAIQDLDLQAICDVEGISERRAVELVRAVRGEADGHTFLATPAARAVHEHLIERIQSHAGTRHGRNRLRLLNPLDPEAAARRMQHVLAMKQQVAALDGPAVRAAMRSIKPLQEPSPRCDTTRLVVAETPHLHERLHGMGVGRWSILGTRRDLAMAGDMDLVVIAYDEGMDVPDFDAVEEVPGTSPLSDLAPAAVLAWVDTNRPTLEACRRLAQLAQRPTATEAVLAARDGVVVPRVDSRGLRREVEVAQKAAQTAIGTALASLSLSGADLLSAMQGGALPSAVQTAVDEAVAGARLHLRDATGLDMQPFVSGLPLRIDEDEVARIERRIDAHGSLQRERSQREAARAVAKVQEAVAAEVGHWLEWDADFALGSFAHALDLQPWRVAPGLRLLQSVHLDLATAPTAQRIDYDVGGQAPVTLLTGANSGGKSTILEHLCQVVVMARLGLPVVGEGVEVPWVDEVHLVTARRGLDAGAFETFLRSFMPAALGDARRLVLADEVESVTELEAAGRILAFFIRRLLATQSLAVVVSHVPQAILGHLPAGAVRVDGIEAKGLDEHHGLIVDRQPRIGHLARSTPELIVERMAHLARGAQKDLYGDLLSAMRDPETRK